MQDYIIRGTAAGGYIRAFAATTKNTVEKARSLHNTSPVATAALGRLLTAGAMMGIMMKGEDDTLTLKIEGNGPIEGLTVIADSHGNVKGYAFNPNVLIHANDKGKLDVAGALGIGVLTIIRDIGLKEPYIGQSILITSEIAEDLTYYFATSEQTPSSVGLGVLMNKNNTVRQAGGFILQLMPGADDAVISALEARLGQISSVTSLLDEGLSPEDILERLLGDMDLEIMEKVPTQFYCNCTKHRVERAIVAIGHKDLQEMIDDNAPIDVCCDFCNTHYEFSVDDLKDIIARS
ncbi:MAG: Hsp33 family molecular chaperone HslO [Lachnospiraceae bacterium]|nr:Hsp33 family molecular chaperone HslO [Lachnospiraceae bacterium]